MIINRTFKTALPVDKFIEEYYKIILMKNEEYKLYNKENEVKIENFDSEINYLKKIKLRSDQDAIEINEEHRIKLKNIIKRIEIRQDRFRDINEKISSTGLLYDYNSFFSFLDSLVSFHNQSILFKEEKELDEEISKNRVKFKALAEMNFSAVVEKIQTSYFNKEYSTYAELDVKLKNLRKIQEKFNITTLLEFTQLSKQIETDRETIKCFLESHINWREREISELLDLYHKKLSIEIRVKNMRERYNTLMERKKDIKDFIEEKLIHQINAVTLNIDSIAYYDETILQVKQYSQQLISEKLNSAIKDAEIASESKKEIITYLKTIRNYEDFSVERKIEIVNDQKNFRNIEKFPKLRDSIEMIKNKMEIELKTEFERLINEKKFNVLDSFKGKNENLEIDPDILAYETLSEETKDKIKSLKTLKGTVNPIKAKMRVISLQPHGLPKLRAIEKFQGEILKNENIGKEIKDKIHHYFIEEYQSLIKDLKIPSENYNLDIYDKLENRYYKIIIRRDKIIKIGRRNEPLNDLVLHCKYVEKEHLAIDMKKRNVVNYFSQDYSGNKKYNYTILNEKKVEGFQELGKVVDKLEITKLLEANIRTVSDDIITFNFTRVYGDTHCKICAESVVGCKGCREEHLDHLRNTTFVFVKNNKSTIYLSDSNGLVTSQENYDATGLKVNIDNRIIFAEYPFYGTERNMITESEYDFQDRFNFKVQLITAKVF